MLRNGMTLCVLSLLTSFSVAPASAQPSGKGKPGGGGTAAFRIQVTAGPEGNIQAVPPADEFDGTVDEEPGDGAGARLNFKTGRNELMEFDFGDCSQWIEDHRLTPPVRDDATVDIRLVVGKWSEIENGTSGHAAHIKVNPDTKAQEFWWVLRYDEDFFCANCDNQSANALVARGSDGSWTITGDLAWVHDNENRPDGANCSIPFTFRAVRTP